MIIETSTCDFLSLSAAEKRGFKPHPDKLIFKNGVPGLGDPIPIPCGCCVGCRMQRARDWTTRCIIESRQHKYNYFVTLTYSDKFLPFEDGRPSLKKKDLQDFMKRFRKIFGDVRFFACGEYGDITHRPHYHLILFCDRPLELVRFGNNLYKSLDISRSWRLGLHEVSIAESGCFAYVAGYCVKKLKSELENFPVNPFLQMSRKPGIGALNFDPEKYRDLKIYLDLGKSAYLPRFLRGKLPFYEELKDELARAAKAAQEVKVDISGFDSAYEFNESERIAAMNKIKGRFLL